MKTTLSIAGMSCGHCVAAVTEALSQLSGVRIDQVRIGSATLEHDPAVAPLDAVVDAVQDAGYDATVETAS